MPQELNKKRALLYKTESFYSAQSTVNGFKKLGIPKSNIELAKILGYRPQHSSEDVDKLIRVNDQGVPTLVSYEEAVKLPSMVVV